MANAVSVNNLNLSSGTVKMDRQQYQMQVRGEYEQSADIADIVVSTTPLGQKVFVRDLASVRDTIKDWISADRRSAPRRPIRDTGSA